MMTIIYVDIETSTWFNQPHVAALPRDLQVAAMEFGCAVTWTDDPEIPFDGWAEWRPDEIDRLWQILRKSDIIAGWNITSFDLPIIARAAGATIGPSFPQIYDLFDIIKQITGRWYKLDVIAAANLDRRKTADGLQAAHWLAEGELARAIEYCRNDVELERDLGQLALSGTSLVLPPLDRSGQNSAMTLLIDFKNKNYTLGGKW